MFRRRLFVRRKGKRVVVMLLLHVGAQILLVLEKPAAVWTPQVGPGVVFTGVRDHGISSLSEPSYPPAAASKPSIAA
jgi:hypothetical protein